MGPDMGLCTRLAGSEGVWARLGATGSCLGAQQNLWVLYPLLSVHLCLLVTEPCLLLSRGSGCRMPAWMWLTSSPPMVSYMSSARYGRKGVPREHPELRGTDVLTSPYAPWQVLLPPRGDMLHGQGLLQQLDSVPAFHLFRELLKVRNRGERGVPGRSTLPQGLEGAGWPQGRDWGGLCSLVTPAPCP